jgi:hypothetical protein
MVLGHSNGGAIDATVRALDQAGAGMVKVVGRSLQSRLSGW